MATVAAKARFEDNGELRARPVLGAFLSASFENDSQLVAVLGANLRAVKISFLDTSDLNASGRMRYAGAVRFDNDAILAVVVTSGPQALDVAAVIFDNPTDLVPRLVSNVLGSVRMDDESDLLVDFAPFIPTIQTPTNDQQWGTVNLVRNPSLEYDEIGLTDWSITTGAAIARVVGDAWAGTVAARVRVTGTAVAPEIRIRSHDGLSQTGFGRSWVGAVAVRLQRPVAGRLFPTNPQQRSLLTSTGAAATIVQNGTFGAWRATARMAIRPVYRDGFTPADTWADVEIGRDWTRVAADPLPSEPTRILDRLDLILAPGAVSGQLALLVDAAQTEEALAGGATTYVDGDQADNARWLGTPGRSLSVRDTA